ncbi:hypothetical protein EYR40_009987 [Pleurotus pulmonarius]|nr:hypothetical protein EYR40_009987 [Pleurotus pulmonarius]
MLSILMWKALSTGEQTKVTWLGEDYGLALCSHPRTPIASISEDIMPDDDEDEVQMAGKKGEQRKDVSPILEPFVLSSWESRCRMSGFSHWLLFFDRVYFRRAIHYLLSMPQRSMYFVLQPILLFLSFSACLAGAQHANGMDMSMDGPMDLASGSMIPYIHFTPGDVLLFLGWVPKSNGAMVGTCIGLFLLGILTRWFAAIRVGGERIWREEDATRLLDYKRDDDLARVPSAVSVGASEAVSEVSKRRSALKQMQHPLTAVLSSTVAAMKNVKIVPQHAYARGIMQIVQSALDFALMLIVMTYQASFIISIVLGLGVGETLFGRYMVVL